MLARLTAAKAVSNSAFRWMAFFLPTLVVAFSASTGQLTTVLGLGEMAGLAMLLVGRHLDRDRERTMVVLSLGLTAVGLLLATMGSLAAFAIGYLIVMVGVALCTVSGHAYLGRRVRFARRARAIGVFETSWASALLVGAPLAAVLITSFGWRGPFVVFSGLAVAVGLVLWAAEDRAVVLADASSAAALDERPRLTAKAWMTVAASSAIGITGLTTVVIAGTWLDEAFGLSTEGVGLIAMAFGAAELLASSSSAAIADRAGPGRATRAALILTTIGLVVMTQADSSLLLGAAGLFLFFVGFEFAIVTSFSIVSEAMPSARGRVLALNTGTGTVLRGFGVSMSGVLYGAFGINGPVGLSMATGLVAIALLAAVERR